MPQRSIRVIRVPLQIEAEGMSPENFLKLCSDLRKYVLNFRLPRTLQGLALWVEPIIQLEEGELRLSLQLIHDGQLPLNIAGPANRNPEIAVTEELTVVAAKLEKAIEDSNGVWDLAAEIANHEVDPGDEVERLRWVSGYPVLSKPRSIRMPNALQIFTRKDTLVLESPDAALEYVEAHSSIVTLDLRAKDGALMGTVLKRESCDLENPSLSRLKEGQKVRMRWPTADAYPWRMMATLAALMEMPLEILGKAVISINTLNPKAIQVERVTNAGDHR
jgi:hypothetical protein